MGKIIVFTGDDLNSKRVKQAFDKRAIPYTEVSLVRYPSKLSQLTRFTFSESVPQVFFNTRHIGGAEATLVQLNQWDNDKKYSCVLKKYEAQIAKAGEPKSIAALIPTDDEKPEVPEAKIPTRMMLLPIELPDGTKTSIMDITEKLKNSLPREELSYKNAIYKNSFTGASALRALAQSMSLREDHAMQFAQHLMNKNIVYSIEESKDFLGDKSIYRLQCFSSLSILNSYKKWTSNVPIEGHENIINRLDRMLSTIQDASLNADGNLDYNKATTHNQFPEFEDAICELQVVNLSKLKHLEMVAFGINVYRVMLRYAIMKVGVPKSDNDRLHLLYKVKFDVGGHEYSFRDWVDGILRGNHKATYNAKVPFREKDERCKFVVPKLDFRIHFALNVDSRLGSRTSRLFETFSAKNINSELEAVSRIFCNDNANITFKYDNAIGLSRLFAWYRSDFFDDNALFEIILGYLDYNERPHLERKRRTAKTINFLDINWSRNACNYVSYDKTAIVSEIKGMAKLLRKFTAPKKHSEEALRMATLHSLNILDTLPEERFDRITNMVKEEFNVPIVLICLVDNDRQWFKSKQWFCSPGAVDETGRNISFCAHAILGAADDVFVVENALEDERFVENPLVTGDLNLRFYAGYTLAIPTPGGEGTVNIGTLCLIDQKPRKFTEDDIQKLRAYALQVRRELRKNTGDSILLSTIND